MVAPIEVPIAPLHVYPPFVDDLAFSFDSLVESLRRDGLADEADGLNEILHEIAWTSSSELWGELGLALKRIDPTRREAFSDTTRRLFAEAARAVRRVWPWYRP